MLTPDRIIATALALIDQDGIDALSTRQLATELGVRSKAVYYHSANKDGLLPLPAHGLPRSPATPVVPCSSCAFLSHLSGWVRGCVHWV
ncbi:TetR/AcrR family transcriptional regulator [Deinococcus oregonensis]|uniref:TetR/AcrR family transcriptional regulator n=1 Tax=Deinococcus oregonensis TaxID=1805970 RepID=A0ABV6B4I2_9DEIO